MKKTFTINVAGFPFTIDDDAYTLLNDYLDTIEHAFARQDDARELVDDIESRVAELLLELTSSGSSIVSAENVENVIQRIGQPEEMIEEDVSLSIDLDGTAEESVKYSKDSATPPPYIPPAPAVKKKLFRDPQNAMLGGVCSGFAYYLNADPTAVRLITVLLTVLSVATTGIAYLILWIVMPEARTPYERMQMMGESPTMENIGKSVTENFREDNSQVQQHYATVKNAGFGDSLASFFGMCAKTFVIIGLIIAIPLLIAMVIVLIGCIFALIIFGTSWGWSIFGESTPSWYASAGTIPLWGITCGIGCILALGIPLYLLVRMGLKKKTPLSKNIRNTLIILWAAGLITGGYSTGRIINLSENLDNGKMEFMNYDVYSSEDQDNITTDEEASLYDSINSCSETEVTDSITTSGSSVSNPSGQ